MPHNFIRHWTEPFQLCPNCAPTVTTIAFTIPTTVINICNHLHTITPTISINTPEPPLAVNNIPFPLSPSHAARLPIPIEMTTTKPISPQRFTPPSPPTKRLTLESDDDSFHDARENLTSSDLSISTLPFNIPTNYSTVEPLPSPAPPPENEVSLFKLIKEVFGNVRFGSDVTNINLPASILDPVSTLEKAKKSMQRGELLQDICASQDPESRFLNVLRFNISGLARERFGKKPYNPVLGEVYRCCFVHKGAAGETLLVAEQVSHHPPITALHLRNDTLRVYLNSYTAPEPRFWGNRLEVKLAGEIRLVLADFDHEEYIITRPYIHMTGFLAGRQRLEFNGVSNFACEKTGLGAEIEYKAKGALNLRAELNGVSGRIYNLATRETLYTMEGHWDKKITLTHVATNEKKVLFDYESVLMEKSMVAICPPCHEEEETFSTKIWAECSKAIKSGDSGKANTEKRKVEEYQRVLKRERENSGIAWKYRYFTKREDGSGYDLRHELKNGALTRLSLDEEEIEKLRSGELVRNMQSQASAELEAEDKGKNGGRRRLLSRARGNA